MAQSNLFILSNGRVAAISKNDGQILWEIKLRQYISTAAVIRIGQIALDGDQLLVGGSGIILCLNTWDGSMVWKNELKGWGYQFVSLAGMGNETATTTKSKTFKSGDTFYILSNSRVAAINKNDGQVLWEIKLSQYMAAAVRITIGQITTEEDKLFIAGSGILLCLSTKDGSMLWKNELKGWGYQFISLANQGNEAAGAAMARAAAVAASTVVVTNAH